MNSLFILGLLSTGAQAEFTDGPVNCSDLSNNEAMYGCLQNQEQAKNEKYKCLKALSEFEVPKKESEEANSFIKPGKTIKGDTMVAIGKPDGAIGLADGEKTYKLEKEKLLQAIQDKFSSEAAEKESYSVVVQTPKGKMKFKFDKKPLPEGQSGFDLGSWKKEAMEAGETLGDDDVFVALGSQDEENNIQNMSQHLDQKVQNFDQEVDEKLSEITQEAQQKIRETRRSRSLTTSDKRRIISGIEAEKEAKEAYWRQKKASKESLKQLARVKCEGQSQLVTSTVLGGNPSSQGGRLPASTTGDSSNR